MGVQAAASQDGGMHSFIVRVVLSENLFPTLMFLSTGPEPYERVRTEYLRLRAEQRVAKLRDSDS
jgi:hypothetical protein